MQGFTRALRPFYHHCLPQLALWNWCLTKIRYFRSLSAEPIIPESLNADSFPSLRHNSFWSRCMFFNIPFSRSMWEVLCSLTRAKDSVVHSNAHCEMEFDSFCKSLSKQQVSPFCLKMYTYPDAYVIWIFTNDFWSPRLQTLAHSTGYVQSSCISEDLRTKKWSKEEKYSVLLAYEQKKLPITTKGLLKQLICTGTFLGSFKIYANPFHKKKKIKPALKCSIKASGCLSLGFLSITGGEIPPMHAESLSSPIFNDT